MSRVLQPSRGTGLGKPFRGSSCASSAGKAHKTRRGFGGATSMPLVRTCAAGLLCKDGPLRRLDGRPWRYDGDAKPHARTPKSQSGRIALHVRTLRCRERHRNEPPIAPKRQAFALWSSPWIYLCGRTARTTSVLAFRCRCGRRLGWRGDGITHPRWLCGTLCGHRSCTACRT